MLSTEFQVGGRPGGNGRLWQVQEEDGQVLCGEPGLERCEGSGGKAPQQASAIVTVSSLQSY